ncbi:hypothetical protein CEXT_644631 [Caerostris extrusa]|uniref:Uncharacterized protein n=1 Tax=Caerostris extrusa TaxID=172846 RepID=A0AAV4R963_CAEEX|nr:hypothetical protein CEXT_644631 [Caerostris extrusa]
MHTSAKKNFHTPQPNRSYPKAAILKVKIIFNVINKFFQKDNFQLPRLASKCTNRNMIPVNGPPINLPFKRRSRLLPTPGCCPIKHEGSFLVGLRSNPHHHDFLLVSLSTTMHM